MAMPTLTRFHRTRLMQIWRSAGWPCRDGIEIDLLAAQLLALQSSPDGREALKLTEAGIQVLADARQRSVRSVSAHDRLARKFAEHLLAAGRIVWRELPLRALIDTPPPQCETPSPGETPLWDGAPPDSPPATNVWRMARPDLFSVRNTTVEAYLQPMVHEVKFTRADLLSDLRHAAKRQAYRWLCGECCYVFPAAVAQPDEIPEPFGVWVLHGDLETGHFERLRPAHHVPCTLPFAVWLTLAKSAPMRSEGESVQALLGEEPEGLS
jgi:hypothetical protein